MSAVREAVILPLLFLTIGLFGGLDPAAPAPWTPPSLFSLVLAVMVVAALVRSGTLAPDLLMHGSRPMVANANGFIVLLSLFGASAQLLNMLTPRSGLPALIVGVVLFVLLLNTLVMSPDRPRLLRSFAVVTGSARTKRVLLALFDVATLGTISQAPLHPAAGYWAFGLVLLFLIGVTLLPSSTYQFSPGLQPYREGALTRTE